VAVTEHAVVIAGGGPTGLMLAGELALGWGSLAALTAWFGPPAAA
jgi:NADH dehydrogenase FAD-containing subunit